MPKTERVLILTLLCLCLTMSFYRLGARPLWDVDEGMHAVTSKEMVLITMSPLPPDYVFALLITRP
jgi:hypothetical protein